MDGLNLIARIAGQRIALPANAIKSVVEVEAITPVPLAPPHVAGLAALRSRVLTVIDSYAALDLGRAERDGLLQAVVVAIDNHLYGLLVDEVEDVVTLVGEPKPMHGELGCGWAHAASGFMEHEGQAILLLDPALLVAGPASMVA